MKMSSEKKKIFGVILSFLLVLSMSVPVMAEDENYPRYLDDAGLLSSSQAQKLEKKLDKISKEHHCDVVIAVANTTNGQDIESFTEDFYDSMGYGQGEKKSGIMLMGSMKSEITPELLQQSCATAVEYVYDRRCNRCVYRCRT